MKRCQDTEMKSYKFVTELDRSINYFREASIQPQDITLFKLEGVFQDSNWPRNRFEIEIEVRNYGAKKSVSQIAQEAAESIVQDCLIDEMALYALDQLVKKYQADAQNSK